MQAYPVKVDGVSSLGGDEYNDYAVGELNNLVKNSGQTLSPANASQMGVAGAIYASHGDFYIDSGAADAYILAAQNSKKSVNAYIDGMRIRFQIGNANTGASTVNVSSLGVKNITKADGTALTSGQLALDEYVSIIFDSGNNRFFLDEGTAGAAGNLSVRTEVVDYTSVNTDGLIRVNALSGDVLVDLFTAIGNVGKELIIKRIDDSFFIKSDDFVDGDVTVGTENINVTGHNLQDLQRIQLTTTGTLPSPLATVTDYFIILIDADNFKIASSRANAVSDTPIDITSAGGGGVHTATTVRNIVTYDGFGAQTIDGVTSRTIATQNENHRIASNDVNWDLIEKRIDQDFFDTGIDIGSLTDAVTTAPTYGTTTTNKLFMGRKAKLVRFRYMILQTTNGTVGSGDYLFSLPFGLEFASDVDFTVDALSGSGDEIGVFGYTGSTIVNTGSTRHIGLVIPFDSTQFRVFLSNFGAAGTFGSAFFSLATTLNYAFDFEIAIDGYEG